LHREQFPPFIGTQSSGPFYTDGKLITCNFRRIGNILTVERQREYLWILVSQFLQKNDHPGLKKILFRLSLIRGPVFTTIFEVALMQV
jgi:hypothetical protein